MSAQGIHLRGPVQRSMRGHDPHRDGFRHSTLLNLVVGRIRQRPSTDVGRCFHGDVRTSALPQTDDLRAAGLTSVASSTRTDVGEALALAIRGRLLVRTDGRNLSCSRDSMLALPLCYSACYSASVFPHSIAVVGPASASCQTVATSCRSSEIVATIASNSVSTSGWCFRKYCCAGLFSRSFAK
jgi:hypothetical protein